MIDPTLVAAMALGGCRLFASDRRGARQAGEREQHELLKVAAGLPAGAEIGEVRPDGSAWWIRIPAAAHS